jgi:hypothetical protein
MSGEIIDFDDRRAAHYLIRTIEGFLSDPPDTEYQRGYLSALIAIYHEALGRGAGDARLLAAMRLMK